MAGIGWLHLSDLHQGQAGARWLWPNVRERFYEDLAKLHRLCGPWDVVLFTGDLTQRGSEAEFALLTEQLEGLWTHLDSLGSKPSLVTVPGNHDLTRPDPKDPAVRLLTKWGDDTSVIREFWDDPDSPYRKVVDRAFANYSKWIASHSLPKLSTRAGLLPGDFSSTLEASGLSIGIVGLNSAFLQLTGANYQGLLDIDSAQMHVACDNDAGAWTRRHHVNLLLTHHPTDWLRPQGLKTFHGEILTPGRFAAHLFGHMHRGRSEEIAIGGAQPRRSLQAPSLFGLDAWGEAHEDRSHGYLAGRISLEGPQATLRVWPRTGSRHAAGHIHIVQDAAAFMLEDDQACAPIQIPVNAEAMRPAKGRAEKIDAARSPFSGVTTAAQVVTKPSQAPNDAALLWRLVLGNDPIAGDRALRDLVSMGDKGQAELFAHAVRVPTLIQARRRLLKYVATRGDNILPEILRRLESEHYRDAHEIAFLLAAFSEAQNVTDPLYVLLKAAPRERKGDFFRAWGHSGGHPSVITRLVQESSWDWEKLRTDAFRGACVSVARQKSGALWTLAELVTRKYGEELPNDPEVTIGNGAVDEGELWLAYGTFAMWPRGAVADEILRTWSTHEHWRVRSFGAGILGSFGFSRITTPTIEWLKGESTAKVRSRLLGALDRAETEMGADAVLEFFDASGEGKEAAAKCAWRATDRQKATSLLVDIANSDDATGAAALWSLAQLGVRHPQLDARLDSKQYYTRSVAAIAVAYLGDKTYLERLRRMQREAGHPHERFFLATALAVLGQTSGGELHAELLRVCDGKGDSRDLDVYNLYRFLQSAVLDGFKATGNEAAHLLAAWEREFEPLEPVPSPLCT